MKDKKVNIEHACSFKDIFNVASLHKTNINQGFLQELGVIPLFFLYQAINRSPVSQLIIAKDKSGMVIGFVSISFNLPLLYRFFLLRYGGIVGFFAFPKLLKWARIKKVLNLFNYGKKKTQKKVNVLGAELLSIVVDKEWRGMGVAEQLFNELMIIANTIIKEKAFKIVVGKNLIPAQKFYEKMGAKKEGEVSIHGNSTSYIYVKKVTDET